MTANNDQLAKDFNRAKIGLMTKMNSVFITTVLFSLKHHWDKTMPTAGVDGINLWVNPDFFTSLTPGQRITLLAHEAWHPAFSHMTRRGNRDPELWNVAGDYVINSVLKNAGYEPLDPIVIDGKKTKWCYDSKYDGMSTEQIYDDLVKDGDKNKQKNTMPDLIYSDGSKSDPNAPKGPTKSAAEQAAVDQAVQDILVKATTQSKMGGDAPGSIPGDIEINLEKMLNPKLPWAVILQRFLDGVAKNDYTYTRPNRRFLPQFYLPSLHGEGLGHVAFAVDSSCSVSDEEFLVMNSEINHVHQEMTPELLTLLNFDTRIQDIHVLTQDDSVAEIKFHGRGGTDVKDMLKYFKKKKPQALVVFTDGEFKTHNIDPGVPVIWVIHNNPGFTYPFGKVIHFDINN